MTHFRSTWHLFHLIMTIATSGAWLIVWLWRTLANSQANRRARY